MGRKIEKYVPNRRFKEIVNKYGGVVDLISGGLGCKGMSRGTKWMGEVDVGDGNSVYVTVVQKFAGRVVVDANVEVVYSDNVFRRRLASVRQLLNASGLKRKVE